MTNAAAAGVNRASAPAAPHHAARPASIHVEVQELVLQGFHGANPRLISSSLEAELASRLSWHDLPAAWRHSLSIKEATTAPLQLRSPSDGRWVGEQLAEAILRAGGR